MPLYEVQLLVRRVSYEPGDNCRDPVLQSRIASFRAEGDGAAEESAMLLAREYGRILACGNGGHSVTLEA